MLTMNAKYNELAEGIKVGDTSLFSILKSAEDNFDIEIIDDSFIKDVIKPLDRLSHKYTCGRSLLVCGSCGMSGAAIIAARAAYRSGAGLVDIALPESIYPIVAATVPEAVFTPLPCQNNISLKCIEAIIEKQSKADAVLIGCGLSCNKETVAAAKEIITKAEKPIIIDADGINCIKDCIEILEQTDTFKIITPHYGEMSRLTGLSPNEIQADFVNVAGRFAKAHNTVVVLKGAFTAVASPTGKVMVNILKGNPGMAVAGSGDMLSGIICALVASGIEPFKAATAAVYLHAYAGDIAADELSERSVTPTDMTERLPRLFKTFE